MTCDIHISKTLQGGIRKAKKQDIISPLGIDETSEWCKSFVLVPKANAKVRLYLDPV